MLDCFNVTVKGEGHNLKKIDCQDASGSFVSDNCAIAVVSDGHGGERYFRSAEGSKIAVEITLNSIREFCDKTIEREVSDKELTFLANYIIKRWYDECKNHFNINPLTDKEKKICAKFGLNTDKFDSIFYGATLIYACMTSRYCFASQIGDGQCLVFDNNGNGKTRIPADERLFSGFTTSLCDTEASAEFRHFLLDMSETANIKGIVLTTDGVSDSYSYSSLELFCGKILSALIEDKLYAAIQLEEWLPELSKQGSMDDMSVSCVYQC